MPPQIGELLQTFGAQGTPNHRLISPTSVRTLPVIDNSNPLQSNVRTSVDCYVSGQYTTRTGKTVEVTQRYTIFVAYSQEMQAATMAQVRARIIEDFEGKYGRTFNVTNVFIPALPIPVAPFQSSAGGAPLTFYRGSEMFHNMTEYERLRYDVGTQKEMSSTNIDAIRRRYASRGGRR